MPSKPPLKKSFIAQRDETGFVLIILMVIAVFLLIALTAAAPSIYTQGQREKEEELIFRGEQYARAIYLFNQRFHRYPTSVKELLHTNGLSFLRQAYPDPFDLKGKWRFIHSTGTGVVTDSETLSPQSSPQGQATPGFQLSTSGQQQTSGLSGPTFSSNSFGSSSGEPKLEGAFIVGVASTSHRESIRVFNGKHHYNKWEFIGIPNVAGAVIPAPPALGAGKGTSGIGSSGQGGGFMGNNSSP